MKMLDEVAENLYVMPPPPKCSPSRARPMPRLRSKGTSRRFGRVEAPEPVSCLALAVGLRLWPDDELGYSSTAHANVLTAPQIAAQSPRDVSNTRVKDAPVLSRARSPCGRADD